MAGWLQNKLDIKCYTSEKELFTAKTFRSMPDDEYAKIFRNVFVRAGMSEEDIKAKGPATRLYKNRVYELPEFEIIKSGHEIESNDGKWLARTDSGHSPEHISLLDNKRQLYLSGDFLLPRISPNISDNFFDPLDDRLGEYFKYLNDIQTIGSETKVFPCHDWPFKDGSVRAKDLIKHHNHRLKLILDELKNRSITIMDSIEIIFDRKIGDEQMHFAIGEARAHLIHLDVTGQAKSEMDDRGTVHYSCL
jgi:glyoxylase-like metal-dependent hydrolase (beta-lactamase superfamily II)